MPTQKLLENIKFIPSSSRMEIFLSSNISKILNVVFPKYVEFKGAKRMYTSSFILLKNRVCIICTYFYSFRCALRYWAKIWPGGREQTPEFYGHIFEVTLPKSNVIHRSICLRNAICAYENQIWWVKSRTNNALLGSNVMQRSIGDLWNILWLPNLVVINPD